MGALRTAVTSVVKVGTSIVSHDVVPMRTELFGQALDSPAKVGDALHKVQRHVAEATQSARSLPVLGGAYFPDVALKSGVALTFAHGLDGTVSWIPARMRAAGACTVNETAQDKTNGRITVKATADCTVDLWLYPAPSVTP